MNKRGLANKEILTIIKIAVIAIIIYIGIKVVMQYTG